MGALIWLEIFGAVFAVTFVFSLISEVSYHRRPVIEVLRREVLLQKARWTLMATSILLVSTFVWYVMGWDVHR